MSYARRVDGNQSIIVEALTKAGYSVRCTSGFGNGFPDLMVKSKSDDIVLMEVKMPKEKLTKAEKLFHEWYTGKLAIVRSVEDALKVMEGLI